jgi:hypothetical protein
MARKDNRAGRKQIAHAEPPIAFGDSAFFLETARPGEERALERCSLCYQEDHKYVAVGKCGHAEVCWLCSVRLRGILRDTRCPICKEDLPEVILTSDPAAGVRLARERDARAKAGYIFSDAVDEMDSEIVNPKFGLLYCNRALKTVADRLFSYTCWLPGCSDSVCFTTLEDLSDHLRKAHARQFCQTCLYGRNVFLHEQLLYDPNDIARHNEEGDDVNTHGLPIPPTSVHSACEFCHEYHYSVDELVAHMNRDHWLCAVCERQSKRNAYYRDSACLSLHYEECHYVCMHDDCQRESCRLVVFATEEELRLHELSKHFASQRGQGKSKKQGVKLNLQMGTMSYRDEQERRRQSQQPLHSPGAPEGCSKICFMWPRSNLSQIRRGGKSHVWLPAARHGSDRYPPQPIVKIVDKPAAKPAVSSWRSNRHRALQAVKTSSTTAHSAASRLLSFVLQTLDSDLHAKDALQAEEYKDRNHKFKLDLQEALGDAQLARFKDHSAALRQVIAQAAGIDERIAAVRKYTDQVLEVFLVAYDSIGECRTAKLLADLVVLLPDRDLRCDICNALLSLREEKSKSTY